MNTSAPSRRAPDAPAPSRSAGPRLRVWLVRGSVACGALLDVYHQLSRAPQALHIVDSPARADVCILVGTLTRKRAPLVTGPIRDLALPVLQLHGCPHGDPWAPHARAPDDALHPGMVLTTCDITPDAVRAAARAVFHGPTTHAEDG